MSEVISFRLDKDNPYERQALEILKAWCTEGFSDHHVITEALLKLNDTRHEPTENTLYELKSTLNQVNSLLEQLAKGIRPKEKKWMGDIRTND